MKNVLLFMSAVLLAFSSCSSLDKVLKTTIEKSEITYAESVTEEISSDESADTVANTEIATEEPASESAAAEEPENDLPSKEEVIAAVTSSDYDKLSALLENVDDVKTIIGKDVPILVMAEEANGVNGIENPITTLLAEKGAYILQRDENGRDMEKVILDFEVAATPRHENVLNLIGDKKQRYWNAIKSDSVDGIRELLEYLPVDSNLLFDAAHQKSTEIVAWALSEGVPVDGRNKDGKTALHFACDSYTHKTFEERAELVRVLLDAGADATAADNKNKTPLVYVMDSAQNTNGSMKEIVGLLIDHGADPEEKASGGITILNLAVQKNQTDTASLLLEKGARPEVSSNTILNMKPDMVRLFVEHGSDPALFTKAINIQDNDEQSKLVHYLVDSGVPAGAFELVNIRKNQPLLEYLVGNGADINQGTVLNACVLDNKDMDIIRYLVDHGADLNRKYYNDLTVLHNSVKKKNIDAARLFIEHGAEINPLDKTGKTPLDYCKDKDSELYKYLVEAGAKTAAELQQ